MKEKAMANNVVILAGGQGKRMKTNKPKVLLEVLGEPMLEWVISACEDSGMENICVVKGFECEQIDEYLAQRATKGTVETALQAERLGTGHAVMCAKDLIGTTGDVVVLCGDTPLITADTIKKLYDLHKREYNGVTVLSAILDDATGYGRIIRDADGKFIKIVEHKDCTEEELKVKECMYLMQRH